MKQKERERDRKIERGEERETERDRERDRDMLWPTVFLLWAQHSITTCAHTDTNACMDATGRCLTLNANYYWCSNKTVPGPALKGLMH